MGLPNLRLYFSPLLKGRPFFSLGGKDLTGRVLSQQCLLSLTYIFPAFLLSLYDSIYLSLYSLSPALNSYKVCLLNELFTKVKNTARAEATAFCRSRGFPL